ncbi:unnamed protein product [Diatraea saccharalis]|uniref:GCF C-terminal domain-containing protein n=1 Tax=Diatraea saccharalis TaxID=40085 RepID=A0A9P0G193_9NEOP|nr:unnamed protein product [Diatraea saccharalis]
MSLFRKPKKIQRRMFCADDEDEGDPEPPPPPIISHEREKKENKPVKPTSLLSFADEEEDGEVFKVKKSSQSKRLAKRREKEKRRAPDGDSNKYDNNIQEEEKMVIDSSQQEKKKKRVTLEGLILSGREALAADGAGDVSDSPPEEEAEEEDQHGFHRYRAESVRAALAVAPGHIPDAALIHAARKTRQQAREIGGDYIALKTEAAPGSRLVRDDGSGDDDDEEGRVHVRGLDLPSDKPKRGTAAAPTNEELDSEVEEWEEQQMQKAMHAIPDIPGEGMAELNPFAAPPPPRLEGASHLRPLHHTRPLTSAHDLLAALTHRLEELQSGRERTFAERAEYLSRLARAGSVRAARAGRTARLDRAYRRAQAARGFLTDLVECLDEKMPALEALESRALALARRRCEYLVERRRADVRDQADDTLALTARPGAAKPVESEEKRRRCAEREGRRRARRMRREECAAAAGTPPSHRDGDSSDDSLPPDELHHYQRETEAIRAESGALFADTLPAWRSIRGVCAVLARWRRRCPALYSDAYVADCLPKLLGPYVRHQLILWNPLADEDNEDYEKMDWYKCLMMYGVRRERASDSSSGSSSSEGEEAPPPQVTEDSVRNDPDLGLVPAIVCRVLVPKLTELVEQAWDPMRVRACVRLRQLVVRLAALPRAAPALRPLAAAARARLAHAHRTDVFLPPLPPQNALRIPASPGAGSTGYVGLVLQPHRLPLRQKAEVYPLKLSDVPRMEGDARDRPGGHTPRGSLPVSSDAKCVVCVVCRQRGGGPGGRVLAALRGRGRAAAAGHTRAVRAAAAARRRAASAALARYATVLLVYAHLNGLVAYSFTHRTLGATLFKTLTPHKTMTLEDIDEMNHTETMSTKGTGGSTSPYSLPSNPQNFPPYDYIRPSKAGSALVAPPVLQVSMGDGNHLPSGDPSAETLCCAAGAAPGVMAAGAAAALADTVPRGGRLRPAALAILAALATRVLARLQSDNPLHLKALEQVRTVIAEARATE